MAYKVKIPPRRLETGEVAAIHWLDRLVAWEAKHRRFLWPIVIVVFVLVSAGAGTWGWFWWQNRRAADLAVQAAAHYPKSQNPEVLAAESEKPPTLTDRCEQALPLYEELTRRYSRSRLAPLALYYQGNCQAILGHDDLAAARYRDVIERYPKAVQAVELATLRLGYLYADEERSHSIEQFQRVAARREALNRDQALYELGRLHETAGDREQALSDYRELSKDYPDSPWTSEAKVHITALGGDEKPEPTGESEGQATPAAPPTSPAAGQVLPPATTE